MDEDGGWKIIQNQIPAQKGKKDLQRFLSLSLAQVSAIALPQ